MIETIGLALLGLFVLGAWSIATAPYGWEDEDGFHYGEPPE